MSVCFLFSVSLNHFFSADCNIAISTYSMVSFTGKRSWEAGEVGEKSETACNALLYECFFTFPSDVVTESLKEVFVVFQIKPSIVIQLYSLKSL